MDMNYTTKLANNSESHGHGDLDHDHDHIAMEDPILHHHHQQISYVHHPVWPNFPLHQMPSSSTHHHHHQVSQCHDQFGGGGGGDHDQLEEAVLVGSTNFMELEDDHDQDDEEAYDDQEEDEQLGAMKEMMYKMAAMQPVDIDPATVRKPKRRNVRISDDPQSVAARHRRERISEKIRILQRLVPGGTKMDTASMLDEAIRYLKFLKRQIRLLQSSNHNPQLLDWLSPNISTSTSTITPNNHHHYHIGSTTAAAATSSSTDTPTTRPPAGFTFYGGDAAAAWGFTHHQRCYLNRDTQNG